MFKKFIDCVQTDRQMIDRQIDEYIDRQIIDRQIDEQKDRQMNRQTDR